MSYYRRVPTSGSTATRNDTDSDPSRRTKAFISHVCSPDDVSRPSFRAHGPESPTSIPPAFSYTSSSNDIQRHSEAVRIRVLPLLATPPPGTPPPPPPLGNTDGDTHLPLPPPTALRPPVMEASGPATPTNTSDHADPPPPPPARHRVRCASGRAPPRGLASGSLVASALNCFSWSPYRMMLLFLAPRSTRRSTLAPPSASDLQHTHELATPMHACEIQ
jgi:hypothetical protein